MCTWTAGSRYLIRIIHICLFNEYARLGVSSWALSVSISHKFSFQDCSTKSVIGRKHVGFKLFIITLRKLKYFLKSDEMPMGLGYPLFSKRSVN